MFDTFLGNAESHNELFTGVLPDPVECLIPISTTTSTTTTTSSSTTTSTTTTQPILPRCQAVSDVIESIALQQTALSHILNAEGEKLQKIISIDDISYETILKANRSVESMVNSVSDLEAVLKEKLALFAKCGCSK